MSPDGMEFIDPELLMNLLDAFIQGGLVISIVTGLLTGLYSVIAWVIQLGCMHFIATSMLGGNGTFKQLIHKTTGITTIYTVAYTLLSFMMIYLYFNAMLADDLEGMGAITGLSCIIIIGSLGYLFWFMSAISKVYEFGKGAGCGTIILGGLMFSFISSIISGGFWAILSPVFFDMMGVMPTGF